MRIGLVGDFTEPRDEGQKNIAHYLSAALALHHEITRLNIRAVFTSGFWSEAKNSSLQILHYIPGPTIKSLAIAQVIGRYHRAKIVLSAPQPRFSWLSERMIPLLRPDLVLVQSRGSARVFEGRGCKTSLVPNGVDTETFRPMSRQHRDAVRERFGIESESFLVLHVGHLTRRRNIEALARIQDDGTQVVMIASEHRKGDQGLESLLTETGCRILSGYLPNIEHVYAMSDCYVFPVRPGDTILTPLSVLEAMACNLPVVSARFEGLTEAFQEGDGLLFADGDADLVGAVQSIKNGGMRTRTRDKVVPYSWGTVAERVERLYAGLLGAT